MTGDARDSFYAEDTLGRHPAAPPLQYRLPRDPEATAQDSSAPSARDGGLDWRLRFVHGLKCRTESYLFQVPSVTVGTARINPVGTDKKTLWAFAQRLNTALDRAGVAPKNQGRQVIVGRMFGVTQKAARKWLEAEGLPDPKKWDRIASALNVRPDWLFYGRGQMANSLERSSGIPVIPWSLGAVRQANPSYKCDEFVSTTKNVGPNTFALRVRGDSMENPRGKPSYPEGAIIIVDPNRTPRSGDRVVALPVGAPEATFKLYREDAGRRWLFALNPQYPPIEISDSTVICGVVVQTIIDED